MMGKKGIIFLLSLCISATSLMGQETFPTNGVKENSERFRVFTNATIYKDYKTRIDSATMVIKNGKIQAIGKGIEVPHGAEVHNLQGKFIYPSFIELHSDYGMPLLPKKTGGSGPQMESKKKGAFYWNEAVKPEVSASELFKVDGKKAKELRALGFGVVLTHNRDGIVRGTGTLVSLDEERENEVIIRSKASQNYSFSSGSSQQDYPSSLMGSIALLRQVHYDGLWYEKGNKNEKNLSLEAFNANKKIPQIIEVADYLTVLRADKVGDEMGLNFIIKGSGSEYLRVKDIKNTGAALIIPLGFPKAYDVEDAYDALNVSIAQLKHWELAPTNPGVLVKNGVSIALTTDGLKKKGSFTINLKKAIKYGLDRDEAIKALTHTPANLVNASDLIGSLAKGKKANFLVVSDELFEDNSTIFQNWINGKNYVVTEESKIDVRGNYHLKIDENYDVILKVEGAKDKPNGSFEALRTNFETDSMEMENVTTGEVEKNPAITSKEDTIKVKVAISISDGGVNLSFDHDNGELKGNFRLGGSLENNGKLWRGNAQMPNGRWVKWKAERFEEFSDKPKEKQNEEELDLGSVFYPNMAYGYTEEPEQKDVIFKNATVWTNESDGILKNTDVWVKNGKIHKIGKINKKKGPNLWIIDATGKHLTCGIVDEHSHIAISRGVNEGAQAVTAEVRIGDVINSDDVNIFRQLAGGVTTSQLLHGSANPIGGQSAIVKWRWGRSPEEMKFEGADGFIKFALGENVKQSNWGDKYQVRFPQTRMGVEQVFYDAFVRAKKYKAEWEKYNAIPEKDRWQTDLPRKDLELDALVEILDKRRFITCHSYVQSEINMLMHVADSMGFKVNTFTHILEGYKVADKMKEHGVGGSTFADWWAYKNEVKDAIPENGAIMKEQGVVVAYNSDDAEMGRRLNQEAGKAIKYGDLSQEEAWKFVTLNPAKLLHIDDRVGSIKVGKDADLVLWTRPPLSIYAICEKTFVDGICYFDLSKELDWEEAMNKERARIIEKMIQEKKNGGATKPPKPTKKRLYHCDSMGE